MNAQPRVWGMGSGVGYVQTVHCADCIPVPVYETPLQLQAAAQA